MDGEPLHDPILVVDDDADIRETLGMVLEAEGYTVAYAANGKQALEAIEARHPRLVFLDLMMPVMSGWEVLETLGRDGGPAHPAVVLITASTALPTDGVPCLRKPVALEDILALAREYMRR